MEPILQRLSDAITGALGISEGLLHKLVFSLLVWLGYLALRMLIGALLHRRVADVTRRYVVGKTVQYLLGFSLAMVGTVIAGENSSYYGAMAALALQAASAALVLTSMQSLVSQCAGPTERGLVLGVYSSAGTLGRVLGTLVTGVIFARLHIESPYAVAVLLMLCLFFIARSVQAHWREHLGS